MNELIGLEMTNRLVCTLSLDDQGAAPGEIPWCRYPLFAAAGFLSVHAMIGMRECDPA